MTISTNAIRVSYAGSGTTGPFAFTFKIFTSSDITVIKIDSNGTAQTLVLNSDYTVAAIGVGVYETYDDGGNVTLIDALASGETLVIYLDTDYSQETDFVNNDGFDADVAEDAYDKNTMLIKEWLGNG